MFDKCWPTWYALVWEELCLQLSSVLVLETVIISAWDITFDYWGLWMIYIFYNINFINRGEFNYWRRTNNIIVESVDKNKTQTCLLGLIDLQSGRGRGVYGINNSEKGKKDTRSMLRLDCEMIINII